MDPPLCDSQALQLSRTNDNSYPLSPSILPSNTLGAKPGGGSFGINTSLIAPIAVTKVCSECLQQSDLAFMLWQSTKKNENILYCLGCLLGPSSQQLEGKYSLSCTGVFVR